MRLALRWLAFLLAAAFVLLYLRSSRPGLASFVSATKRPSSHSSDDGPQQPLPPVVSAETGAIGEFWGRWSQLMYDARPEVPPIVISGMASTMPPSNPNTPRKPCRDRVMNSGSEIEQLRRAHSRFVEELDTTDIDDDVLNFHGRGVVMVGGGEYFGPAIIGIQMLRRTGSTLPVEVFVPDDDEYEAEVCERYLPKLNARCLVLTHFQVNQNQDQHRLDIKHYQLKAPALLLSSFAEVLLLDSDSIPLVDPETAIFQTEPFVSRGLITWPDFWEATESRRFWTIAGRPTFPKNLPATSAESGQLVYNKTTHLRPLLLATYYNMFGQDYYYPLLSQNALGQGDKETFMAAAVALNASYYRVKSPASSIGRNTGGKHMDTGLIQYSPSSDLGHSTGGLETVRPAFLHSNTPKMNAGHLVDEGDLVANNGRSRLRLLGPKADAEKLFGFDVEDTLWDLLVQTGCDLASHLRDWRYRDRLCERLTEHHQLVFAEA